MWSSLLKFGLQHCDMETMLQNVNFLMRTLTLNIDNQCTKSIPMAYYLSTLTLAACYYYVFLICMIWMVAYRTPQTGDWIGATIVASLGISSEISTAKLIYMYWYKRQIRELVDMYRACNSMLQPGSRFEGNLLKKLRIVKKRAILFWIMMLANGLVYSGKPFLLSGRHFMEDSVIIYGLEPKYESPNYEISHLLMIGGVVYIIYLTANTSAFLIIITGYTEAQMSALTEEMLLLWSDAQEYYQHKIKERSSSVSLQNRNTGWINECRNRNDTQQHYEDRVLEFTSESVLIQNILFEQKYEYITKSKIVNEYIGQRLQEFIKIHSTNIHIVQKVEKIYRVLIAAEFILLTFGITVELLGHLENTYLQIPFSLMQVMMDCLSGQRVMDASLAFEAAVYASRWERFDVTNMKTVQLMLQMSQKTLRLSAGGVTMLSFTSFASVIRIIYSGYTALRQLY